ncbi:MAG: SDR family oxidoreductase [Chitinophagales bacterium]|nr:SDR family oxidoreductase [Chitinophagales bacterium]
MKVFITGGAGYIGTELIYKLNENPAVKEIILYDNLIRSNYNLFLGKTKLDPSKVKFVRGELLDTRKLYTQLKGVNIVFHLAAKVSTPFADHNPHEFDQINNWGTAELTYLLENCDVETLVHMSSASIYGSSNEEATIDTFPNPRTFYGISKLRGEEHVSRLIGSNIKTYIIRCGNVYGYSKSMRFDSVINKFIFQANFVKQVRVYGDGNQSRSFIQIDRLSQFLNQLITSELKSGFYNLVENTYSVGDIIEALKQIYPELEMIFVNQQMKVRNLIIAKDERLEGLQIESGRDLLADLKEFKKEFSF